MKAIIYHTLSKRRSCEKIAKSLDGDVYQIIQSYKPIKFLPFQMFVYGYMTLFNKEGEINKLDIDFSKYDEVVLISPVWASRINPFMRSFLKQNEFHDKKVTIIGSCDSSHRNFFKSFNGLIDGCNEIVNKEIYIRDKKQ